MSSRDRKTRWQRRIRHWIERKGRKRRFVSDMDIGHYVERRQDRESLTFASVTEKQQEAYISRLVQKGMIYQWDAPSTFLKLARRHPRWMSLREYEMGHTLRKQNQTKGAHRVIYRDEPFEIDYRTGRYILSRPTPPLSEF